MSPTLVMEKLSSLAGNSPSHIHLMTPLVEKFWEVWISLCSIPDLSAAFKPPLRLCGAQNQDEEAEMGGECGRGRRQLPLWPYHMDSMAALDCLEGRSVHFIILLFYLWVFARKHQCTTCMKLLRRSEEGVRIFGFGFTD